MTDKTVEAAIKKYQCMGCVDASYPECFEAEKAWGLGCAKHLVGTMVNQGIGKVFLGLPKGFNRLGHRGKMRVYIFKTTKPDERDLYDFLNVPVWKRRNENGHVLIRGLLPRFNEPFLHIILDMSDEEFQAIDCISITDEHLKRID